MISNLMISVQQTKKKTKKKNIVNNDTKIRITKKLKIKVNYSKKY